MAFSVYVFGPGQMAHDHRPSGSDRMLTARLMSVAKRRAPWREPTRDETNAAVPELREIAGDRPDQSAPAASQAGSVLRIPAHLVPAGAASLTEQVGGGEPGRLGAGLDRLGGLALGDEVVAGTSRSSAWNVLASSGLVVSGHEKKRLATQTGVPDVAERPRAALPPAATTMPAECLAAVAAYDYVVASGDRGCADLDGYRIPSGPCPGGHSPLLLSRTIRQPWPAWWHRDGSRAYRKSSPDMRATIAERRSGPPARSCL
jgi:hypothetical protein